jgi:hemerythrin-like domain-containing protein
MADEDTEIDGLIDEHRELMTMMATLRRTLDEPDADVSALLDEMGAALAHHTEREESGLFHTLRAIDVGPEYVGLFEHDHGYLVDLLDAARRDRAAVHGLLDGLEAHMSREEADMFPAAEQLLGPADWDAVDAAVAHLR